MPVKGCPTVTQECWPVNHFIEKFVFAVPGNIGNAFFKSSLSIGQLSANEIAEKPDLHNSMTLGKQILNEEHFLWTHFKSGLFPYFSYYSLVYALITEDPTSWPNQVASSAGAIVPHKKYLILLHNYGLGRNSMLSFHVFSGIRDQVKSTLAYDITYIIRIQQNATLSCCRNCIYSILQVAAPRLLVHILPLWHFA